jgi:PEP-CTERM motif
MANTQAVKNERISIELVFILFALISLLAMALPSRERSLLPFGPKDISGFLVQSAADERLPDPFTSEFIDPEARTGFTSIDQSTRLINRVLRSGGATPRNRSRTITGANTGADATTDLTSINAPVLGLNAPAVPNLTSISSPVNSAPSSPTGVGSSGGNTIAGGSPIGSPTGGGAPTLTPLPPLPPPDIVITPEIIFGPVPEPSTWLLLILGFGFIGFVLRKRRNADFNSKSTDLILS